MIVLKQVHSALGLRGAGCERTAHGGDARELASEPVCSKGMTFRVIRQCHCHRTPVTCSVMAEYLQCPCSTNLPYIF